MQVISRSVNATVKIGQAIAKNLKPGDIICLFGELGSGKTVLAKGIASGLGIPRESVISPSFVLLRIYAQAKFTLNHFDLYRLKYPEDVLALGYEEYLYDTGVTLIEWADRLKYLLPKEFLKIGLFFKSDTQRRIKFSACGRRYKELLKEIHESR